jgi:hypothetical protein
VSVEVVCDRGDSVVSFGVGVASACRAVGVGEMSSIGVETVGLAAVGCRGWIMGSIGVGVGAVGAVSNGWVPSALELFV